MFAPIAGGVGRLLLSISGKSVLSDLDIAYFFLTPYGMVTAILFAALLITVLVFEQSSLMALCAASFLGKPLPVLSAIHFTFQRTKNIFLFSLQLIIRVLLLTLPFLGLCVAIAWVMLSEYDINYYLAEKPPIFVIAVTSSTLVLFVMTKVLLRNLMSWSLALSLVLFNHVSPTKSYTTSEQLAAGKTQFLLETLGKWILAATLPGIIIVAGIRILGSTLAPLFYDSIILLVPALGGLAALWCIANFLLTTFTAGSFAALLVLFYDHSGSVIPETIFTHTSKTPKAKAPAFLFGILLFTSALAAVFTGGYLLKAVPGDNHTMIIAHRGASGKAPENTMVAIRHAIDDGTDWIEIDVQETADGKIVVIHDSDLMQIAGVDLKIWQGSLNQIQQIDVGSWFNEDFSAARVPTLEEVLAEARGKCRMIIELKYYGHDQELEQRVVDIVEQTDMVAHVAIMSLWDEGIERFRALRPKWPVGLLSSKTIGKISSLDVSFLAINMASAKPAFIRRIQSSGKQVFVWTVNDQASMARMMALGVDGIITNEPALAREVLNTNKTLTPVERLLLHTAVLFHTPIPSHTYRDNSP